MITENGAVPAPGKPKKYQISAKIIANAKQYYNRTLAAEDKQK